MYTIIELGNHRRMASQITAGGEFVNDGPAVTSKNDISLEIKHRIIVANR